MKKFSAFLTVAALASLFAGGASAQKKPLDHDAYDSWQRVSSVYLSDDGKILSYQVSEQEGDNYVVVRSLATGKELRLERASGFEASQAADFAVCKISPAYALTRQAKIDKKKKDEMPKDTVAVINLKTFEVTRLPDVSGAEVGFDAAPFVFASKEDKDAKDSKLLIVHSTATGQNDTIRNVASFKLAKSGDRIAFVTAKEKKDSLSKSAVYLYDVAGGGKSELSEGRKSYSGLRFNEGGDLLVFLASDNDEKVDGTPRYSVNLAREVTLKKATRRSPAVKEVRTAEVVSATDAALPEGWVIGKNAAPLFSNGSGRLVLNLNRYFPAKDTTLVSFETASLDIWNYDSYRLPPMDKAAPPRESLKAVVNLSGETGSLLVLSESPFDRVTLPAGAAGDYAISMDTKDYAVESLWEAAAKMDISVVSLSDGSRRSLAKGNVGTVIASPSGKYLTWFNPEDGDWYCWNVATGEKVNLTAGTGVKFWDEEDDHPAGYQPYSYPDWQGSDDESLLIEDRYDVWRFSPDGRKAENLTKGEGRRTRTDYSVVSLGAPARDPYLYLDNRNLARKGKLYLSAFSEETSENGYAVADLAKPSVPAGFTAESSFQMTMKAAHADVFAYLKGDFRHPMDLYTSSDIVEDNGTRLTGLNPQQEDYLWGDVKLVRWKAYDGTPLKGLLYTPENLDTTKKYPMMVYFYEKNSEALYGYYAPAPSRSIINIPFYVSRGYVVFVPDVVYTVGHPGKSAYNCICAGAEAMCAEYSFIDRSRMAIQGQSWGGYQVAYLVTCTDMFAAAGAGAPVGNMTSAYGGIRWESGNSRISQYEHGQSRIGATLWDKGGLDLYIENSPVFFAPAVKTPVLIMHNDADGAVPWYQGIEFFMSLRRLGKPAWLLEYNNEAHNLRERRNCKDLSIRLQQFFDHYLQGAPEPVWMKSGIPYERKGSYFGYEYAE